jgi:hypothetical protein
MNADHADVQELNYWGTIEQFLIEREKAFAWAERMTVLLQGISPEIRVEALFNEDLGWDIFICCCPVEAAVWICRKFLKDHFVRYLLSDWKTDHIDPICSFYLISFEPELSESRSLNLQEALEKKAQEEFLVVKWKEEGVMIESDFLEDFVLRNLNPENIEYWIEDTDFGIQPFAGFLEDGNLLIRGPYIDFPYFPESVLELDYKQKYLSAYRKAIYRVEVGSDNIFLKVGEAFPSLDALIKNMNATAGCFITAWNPKSVDFELAHNQRRNEQLKKKLDAKKLKYIEGDGLDPDDSASVPERSYFVFGIDKAQAIHLAQKFGQNAILWCELNSPVELVWTD